MPSERHEWFIAQDGTKLHVRCLEPDRPPHTTMVFLHGASVHSGTYRHSIMPLVIGGMRVVLPDMRGHGDSEGPAGEVGYVGQYSDDFVAVVRKVWDETGKPLLLGGHSSGANMLLRAVPMMDPQVIAGIILVAPTFAGEARFMKGGSVPLRRVFKYTLVSKYFMKLSVSGSETKVESIKYFVLKYFLASWGLLPARTKVLWFRALPDTEPYFYSYKAAQSLIVKKFEDCLAAVRAPVMLVAGEKDPWVNVRGVALAFRWAVPPSVRFEVVLSATTGHFTAISAGFRALVRWRFWLDSEGHSIRAQPAEQS